MRANDDMDKNKCFSISHYNFMTKSYDSLLGPNEATINNHMEPENL